MIRKTLLLSILLATACGESTIQSDPIPPGCGDGIVQEGEACDDGAANSDTNADACRMDCTSAVCGDGVADSGEECDDGDGDSADTNSDTLANACRSDCMLATCGDGVLDSGELCDDGTAADEGNGCSSGCLRNDSCGDSITQSLYEQCDDGSSLNQNLADACRPTCILARCGDGVVDTSEGCDNGSENSDTLADACRGDCTLSSCGDGIKDSDEECDGGPDNLPGCSDLCVITATCGDGTIEAGAEACDNGTDNSDTDADACRTNCQSAYCGDGVLDTGETCDDGVANSNEGIDACRLDCSLPTCGDGVVDTDEDCDDGDTLLGMNGCSATCSDSSLCGDGVIQSSFEECDNGVLNDDFTPDACRLNCLNPFCGDGAQDTGELCDDGNNDSFDYCSASCDFEPWRMQLSVPFAPNTSSISWNTPAAGGAVVGGVDSSGLVTAVNGSTGEIEWQYDLDTAISHSMILGPNRSLALVTNAGVIQSLPLNSKDLTEPTWSYPLPSVDHPALGGGLAAFYDKLIAFDGAGQAHLLNKTGDDANLIQGGGGAFPIDTINTSARCGTEPSCTPCVGCTASLGNAGNYGIIVPAADQVWFWDNYASTATLLCEPTTVTFASDVIGRVAIVGDGNMSVRQERAYVVTADNHIAQIAAPIPPDCGDPGVCPDYEACPVGEISWEYIAPQAVTTGLVVQQISTDVRRLYYGAQGGLVVALDFDYLGSDQPTVAWQYNAGAAISATPAVNRFGNLYVGDDAGILHALKSDGTAMWTKDIGATLVGSPLLLVNRIVVTTEAGEVIALEVCQGDLECQEAGTVVLQGSGWARDSGNISGTGRSNTGCAAIPTGLWIWGLIILGIFRKTRRC